ncbi:transcription factor ILR3-like [Populus alba x Populus x berolinensis]|nr:transcription factor ILR3-like [Populus alba x Populus x berolinensis]
MVSPGNAALLLDYDQYINMDAINIPAQDPNFSAFSWPPLVQPHHHQQQQQQQQQQQKQQTMNAFAHTATVSCPNFGVEIDGSFGECDVQKEPCSKKRGRSESCSASSSKACREKLRRDRLNDKFIELGSILEPGRTPKTDKAAILVDAVRMVTQLRGEAQKLRDSNSSLQEKIKELKAEKIELRDEKQRLKAEKEKLEHQLKAMSSQPSFMPAPPAIPAAFATQGQAPGNKLMPFIGYPGVAMWQFMPPAAVDTSQDHVLHPPVA